MTETEAIVSTSVVEVVMGTVSDDSGQHNDGDITTSKTMTATTI